MVNVLNATWQGEGRRPFILVIALAIVIAIAFGGSTPLPAYAQSNLEIINHVFTSRVLQDRDGAIYPQDTLVGFEKGVATFHTVTHIALKRGTYELTMVLVDPNGQTVAQRNIPKIDARRDDWSEALWVEWRNVNFRTSGRHELRIMLGKTVLATFRLIVS